MNEIYDDAFYKNRDANTRYAANVILNEVLKKYSPKSAIDIGCGVGTWLSVFKEKTGGMIVGVDGSYVNKNYIVIKENEFYAADLEMQLPALGKKFDLAISLEVAEHLSRERAKSFVDEICEYSDVVLFSAATKGQGGDGHKNEQRLSYWVDKFESNGYDCLDFIREKIWNDTRIPDWYRNNVVLFSREKGRRCRTSDMIDIIHPEMYERRTREFEEIAYEIKKRDKLNDFYESWVSMLCTGESIGLQLRNKGYRKIAIYGCGRIGHLLYKELESSDEIDVEYFIDHFVKQEGNITVLDYTDKLPEVDAIVVSPLFHFDEIMNDLRMVVTKNTDIIGVEELMNSV